jgi:hypothetical protein
LLLKGERQKFLGEEWPRIHATIQRLGLTAEELLNGNRTRPASSETAPSSAPSSATSSAMSSAPPDAAEEDPKP